MHTPGRHGSTQPVGQAPLPSTTTVPGVGDLRDPGNSANLGKGRVALLRGGAAAGVGLGLAYLVGRDGSPGWQALRVALVVVLATAAGVAAARLSPLRRGGPLLAVGIAGAGAGAGIAVTWVAKAGLTFTTAAGVLALAAGLAALVLGLADLTSRLTLWLRWGIATVLALVTAVPILSLAIAVAATNVPRTALGPENPTDRGLAFEAVTFPAADGVPLSGWYLPATRGAAVVLLHGSGSTRSTVLDQAVVLARGGYGVLLYDARGHGESGGRAMGFGWNGDADISGALDFLTTRPEIDPGRIALAGLSMGGEQAIGAAAGDPRVRAVVAEGATGRTAADKAWLSGAYGLRGTLQEGLDHLTYWLADLMTAAGPPPPLYAAVAAFAPRPLLLIAAGEVPDEPRAARYLQEAAPSAVTVWEVPGAGHTSGLATAPAEWEQRVLEFLSSALGPTEG